MLRVYQSTSAAQAKDYFSQELTKGDYYLSDNQEIAGNWGGKAATMLGLSGQVDQESFNSLVDNIHPENGERLTAHNKDNRRPGYDLTFNAPKALSVLYEYSQDERLLDAFRSSVNKTMEAIEENMHTRVRKDGLNEDRKTGNLVYAEFIHFTARPVEGMAPDPHLHAHCFVMNATHDAIEDKWKAGQFGEIKRDAPYFEAMFHSHLAKSLDDMGLNIERDGKFWTVQEINKQTLNKFSNRTEQIEKVALDKNITNAKQKDKLGQKLRSKKVGGLSRDTLRDNWWDRLDPSEKETLDSLLDNNGGNDDPNHHQLSPHECLDYAISHHSERQSVVPLTRLKETALRYGVGQITPEELNQAVNNHKDLITVERNGREMATTENILMEESVIIQFTKNGYASQDKLNADYEIGKVTDYQTGKQFSLSDEQHNVVDNLLNSRDRVMALQGKAGTGKTTTLATLIDGIEKGGGHLTSGHAICLAPTADAAYDTLKKDGEAYQCEAMQNAHTLARYFVDEKLWKKDAVLLVDEAGLMSVDDMHTLYSLANAHNNRIVLIGDTSQHSSVNRGDAYRILQEEALLEPLILEQIRRQKGEYKEAVNAISKGKIMKGYDKLDDLKAITQEVDDDVRYQNLAEKYADIVESGKSILAVSPTHVEGKIVTDAIRDQLKERGHISGDEQVVTRYKNLHFTEAERSDIYNYQEGQLIRFQQNAKPTSGSGSNGTINRGDQFTISNIDKENVWIKNQSGKEQVLNLDTAKQFNIYKSEDIALSIGDQIQITEGGKSKPTRTTSGKRLNNGSLHKVKAIHKNGDIKLENGSVLDGARGNFNYGYVTTSHSSQGKTVDHVLIAQSSDYSGATSAEQFYVSVSRGKKSVEIFTDDKEELRQQIQNSHQRISATELTRNKYNDDPHMQAAALRYYAKHSMGHLEGTEQDYLQEFRDPPPAVNDTKPTSGKWQDKIRQQHDDKDILI